MPKAGHFVPTFFLEATKAFLSDYITNQKLTCAKGNASACDTAPIMCKYMDNCTGNGVCQSNGQCKCNDGFKSADCSEKVEVLTNLYSKTFNTNGTQWIYFMF